MTSPAAAYSFFPWLRRGIARRITTADEDPNVKLRATVPVELRVIGEPIGGGSPIQQTVTREMQFLGPGDIIGIDSRAVVRTEPRNWITNFEPNFLAHMEFYDEDFLWRYTPAEPDRSGLRLRPWIMLVVLEEGEFEEGTNIASKPLSYITVERFNALFPPAEQLWAWAHVHVNGTLAASEGEFYSTDMSAVVPRLQNVLNTNPDLAYSRLLCPRKLAENRAYHAFLVPVFETGRLAGLGLRPHDAPHATFSAWGAYTGRPDATSFPFYYRWYFRTGVQADFEYLVGLLQHKPVDHRVGVRAMDVRGPLGAGLPGITDPDLGGVLKLGGALRVPLPLSSLTPEEQAEVEKYEKWATPYPHPFQKALASFVNLADDYMTKRAGQDQRENGLRGNVDNDHDPLITAPLYGRWHALTRRLLQGRTGLPVLPNDNWIHELNLDPRYRAAAGLGTRVIQKYQDEYMNAVWQQVGNILEANARIRGAQFAKEISRVWFDRHLLPLQVASPEKAFALTAPVHRRIVLGRVTIHYQKTHSLLPPAATSVALRRLLRPRGRLMRSLVFNAQVRADNLFARITNGEVSAAPRKVAPPGLVTSDRLAEQLLPKNVSERLLDRLRRSPSLRLGSRGLPLSLSPFLSRWSDRLRQSDALREANQTLESLDRLPHSPNFLLTEPGSAFRPRQGDTDSPEATRFKSALRDWYLLRTASKAVADEPTPSSFDVSAVTAATVAAINPEDTIPRRVRSGIQVPVHIRALLDDAFQEVMTYPEIDLPMYKPLADLSVEFFIPNLNLIEQNSITLLQTNKKFVEAYMVGLNHEFARELLWREFPTDQRGSYFRQFWDARSFFDTERRNEAQLKEMLRDIPELHQWLPFSKLGDHHQRVQGGENAETVVLVIRGELLKKYPTAVMYAHRAAWETRPDGSIDATKPRKLVALTPEEEDLPPRTKVRTPLYEAKIDPDIYFLGFDLTVPEAQGGTGESPEELNPGWFFVIKERPGEPRFGLDIERTGPLHTFNDLSWTDAFPNGEVGAYLQAMSLAHVALQAPSGSSSDQYSEDVKINAAPSSAARWAYLLYQAPVMVAIHAAEMLRHR